MTAAEPAVRRHHRVPVARPEVNHEVGEVVPELGAFILPGRIKDPAAGMKESIEAERAGFGTVSLSERYGLKDTGSISGAVAALTQRDPVRVECDRRGFTASAAHSHVGVDHAGPVRQASLSGWAAATGHRSHRTEFRSCPCREPVNMPTFCVDCDVARRSATKGRAAGTRTRR
jgi:hypothetical protein